MKFKNLSIRWKLIVMQAGIGLAAVLMTGLVCYWFGSRSLEQKAFDHLTSLRSARASEISSYFQRIEKQVESLSEDPTLIDAFQAFASAFSELAAEAPPTETLDIFYREQFLPTLVEHCVHDLPLEALVPTSPRTLYLQDRFIAANPHALGRKEALLDPKDGSRYGDAHVRYHPVLRKFIAHFGFYDLFLVDAASGDVVYTVEKEVDFATNLIAGPHKDSGLAKAFRAVRDLEPTEASGPPVVLVDFEAYVPSYGAPQSFVAAPILGNDGKTVGVLVFQMPVDEINRIMTGDRGWLRDGLGESGESYLVGPDSRMRSNSRFLLQDPNEYLATLARLGASQQEVDKIRLHETTILLQEVRTHATEAGLRGATGTEVIRDYRDVPVLSSYTPLEIAGRTWVLLAEMDAEEAFAPARQLLRLIALVALGVLALVVLAACLFARAFSRPVTDLMEGVRAFSAGERAKAKVSVDRVDEFGQLAENFNEMVASIDQKQAAVRQKSRESERLLHAILPHAVAKRLKESEGMIADSFPEVSILFADLVGFTRAAAVMLPSRLLSMLNALFTLFDEAAERHNVEKIKTIGDAYMAAAGLPERDEHNIENILKMALEMLEAIRVFNDEHDWQFDLRIGINAGPVIAGVIGKSKFIYDLWGDTVNVASRMESTGVPGSIQVTEIVYQSVSHIYEFEERTVAVKGKGELKTYLLRPEAP